MTASIPPLSVVVTTYRRAHELQATLDSILNQSFGDFELIVSDDNSPDNTEEVCRELERRDPRVRYRRNARNLSMPGNLNAGIREARAPLVANLHDGDVFRPDLLARWKDALDQEPAAAFVFNGCTSLDAEGRPTRRTYHSFKPLLGVGELVHYYLGRLSGEVEQATIAVDLNGVPFPTTAVQRATHFLNGPFDSPVWGTVMARRSCYDEAGYFDWRYGFISDVDMWIRLNIKYPVVYIRDPLISLAPRNGDRPHAFVSWKIERALMGIYEDGIDRAYADDPAKIARYRRYLRQARDRRWVYLAGLCLRHGRRDLFEAGLRMFRAEDSAALRLAGSLASVAMWAVPNGKSGAPASV
jgi:glycosyltransferase involved in cell wall biosynthesis